MSAFSQKRTFIEGEQKQIRLNLWLVQKLASGSFEHGNGAASGAASPRHID